MSQLINRRQQAQLDQLLNGLQRTDPRLYDILRTMSRDIKDIMDVVDPMQTTVKRIEQGETERPQGPTAFIATISALAVTFLWSSTDPNVRYYELRVGASWETGTFVIRTLSLTVAINPIAAGSHTYWLKTLSSTLVECENAVSTIVTVDAPEAPSVTAQVVDNNVLLSWVEPASDFAIDFYRVYRDDVQFAELSGTFLAKFEVVSGTYVYGVEAVDLAGNAGARGSVSASVRQPPDYNLLSVRNIDFTLGTRTNCVIEAGKLIACVDTTETFQAHFTSKSWASPNDQIVPYERFIQENLLTGSYDETYDYTTTLNNIIVNTDFLKENFVGTNDVTVVIKTYYSTVSANGPWTGPLTGNAVFIPSFRYLRTVLEFTATDDDSMIAISSFTVRLDVKREADSGYVNALASDTTGTVVNFNKAFLDVDGVECTADSVSPITVIVDFVDAPNPTSFKVLCYDSAGRRVDQLVYWIARGIV